MSRGTDPLLSGMSGKIAGYRLDGFLGRGGLAVVYLAQDERQDRTVAVKVLTPELAGDMAFRTRFLHEAQAAAAVGHPNIIPVYEVGEADGSLFVAMRYVQGGDARSLLNRLGPLPFGRAWSVIAQVASALDAAHAHGLIHRDVKPTNMLLDAEGAEGGKAPRGADGADVDHVYLSDFGISKSPPPGESPALGQFAGTLDYVAPEQIEGRAVDGRADLYSLACTGFELLCGTPPFGQDQGLTVMYAQLYAPPPMASARRPDLPAGVDQVLATALAKNPADRYPTCGQFSDELRAALGVLPDGSQARPRATSDPVRPDAPASAAGYTGPFPPARRPADPDAAAPDAGYAGPFPPAPRPADADTPAPDAGYAGPFAPAPRPGGPDASGPDAGYAGPFPPAPQPAGPDTSGPDAGYAGPFPPAPRPAGPDAPVPDAPVPDAGPLPPARRPMEDPAGPDAPVPDAGYTGPFPTAPRPAGYAGPFAPAPPPPAYGGPTAEFPSAPAGPRPAGAARDTAPHDFGFEPAEGQPTTMYEPGWPEPPGGPPPGGPPPGGPPPGGPPPSGADRSTALIGGTGRIYPVPTRQPSSRRRLYLAAAAAAVVVIAVVIGLLVTGGSGSSTPPSTVSPGPSPSVSTLASRQAVAVNDVLGSSATARRTLVGAIGKVRNCRNLPLGVRQIRRVVRQRGAEYRHATALSTAALAKGSVVKTDLVAALRASLNADRDYLTWAQQQMSSGCKPAARSAAYRAAQTADDQADSSKAAFVQVWNPVAARYGVPQKSPQSI